jgi:hypothetical protein
MPGHTCEVDGTPNGTGHTDTDIKMDSQGGQSGINRIPHGGPIDITVKFSQAATSGGMGEKRARQDEHKERQHAPQNGHTTMHDGKPGETDTQTKV